MAETVENAIDGQPPAKPESKKPAKKVKQPKQPKPKKQDNDVYLPVLAEFTFTSSAIFLILAFLAMAAVSWLSGTSLRDFVLRTSAAMAVLGALLMLVTRQVTTEVLNTNMEEIKQELEKTVIEALNERQEHENLQPSEELERAEFPETGEAASAEAQ